MEVKTTVSKFTIFISCSLNNFSTDSKKSSFKIFAFDVSVTVASGLALSLMFFLFLSFNPLRKTPTRNINKQTDKRASVELQSQPLDVLTMI